MLLAHARLISPSVRVPGVVRQVSNGARVERLNWKADLSSRGMENSFGVMVNYV